MNNKDIDIDIDNDNRALTRVVKGSDHMKESIHRLDMREKGVPQPGTLTRSLDQSRNVGHMQLRGDARGGVPQVTKPLEASIRNVAFGFIGFDCAELWGERATKKNKIMTNPATHTIQ